MHGINKMTITQLFAFKGHYEYWMKRRRLRSPELQRYQDVVGQIERIKVIA